MRCACLAEGRACDGGCECAGCRNPLNGVDVSRLSRCAIRNIAAVNALDAANLGELFELPCCCERVPLQKLLGHYACGVCGETYWYSFCWSEVVQDSCTWALRTLPHLP